MTKVKIALNIIIILIMHLLMLSVDASAEEAYRKDYKFKVAIFREPNFP